MLTAVITGPDLFSAKRQIKNASVAEAIEIRLDCLDSIDLTKVKKLQEYWGKTTIFSLRRKNHGGKYLQHDKKLYFDLSRLFSLEPEYFDLEYDISLEFIANMKKTYPEIKIIFSYHDFNKTPDNLNEILEKLKNPYATYYKIATFANNSIDALKMLEFIKNNQDQNLSGISMGDYGCFVRVVSKIYDNKITYCHVDKKITSGQISLDDLVSVYNFKKINSETKIYALLGYPIEDSFGHVFHNSQFASQNKNAVYIKINLQEHELPVFFSYVKKLPFYGFSITKPLKEKILSFLDVDNANVNSINTILYEDQKYIGYNTDGIAALDAIEKKIKVENKKVFLIGAGGVAKPIAHELIKRKANLFIFNRNQSKAYELASKLQSKAYSLDKLEEIMMEGYDVLINATSASYENIDVVPYQRLIPGTIIMDVVSKPVETVLLKNAQEKNCLVIYGMEMFINQAKVQFSNI